MTAERVAIRLLGLAAAALATSAIVASVGALADRSVARTKPHANAVRLKPVVVTAPRPGKQAAREAAGKRL